MLLSIVHSPGWGYEAHCACMPETKVLRALDGEGEVLRSLVQNHARQCEHRVDGDLRALDDDEVSRLGLEPASWFTDDDLSSPAKPPLA